MALILPFLAAFAVYGVATPYLSVLVRSLGYGPAVVGFLLGLFEVSGIAGPFLIGKVADRMGRYRPALAVCAVLMLAALPPLALLRHPAASAVALVVLAMGVRSMVPVLDASATVVLGPSGDYGRVRVFGSVSFVVTALGLQFTPVLRPVDPFGISAWIGVAAIALLVSLAALPDGGPADRRRAERGSRPAFPPSSAPPRLGSRAASWDPAFLWGLAVIGLSRIAMAPVVSFFSLYLTEELRWDAVGLMWALSAGSEIPVMFLSARLVKRFGPPRLLALSSAAVAARLAVYALFPTPGGAVAGQLLHSICYGLFHPAAVAFVATRVPPEKRATGMAMYLSVGVGLPTFLGSSIGGLVVEAAGYRVLFASFISFAAASLALYAVARGKLEAPVRA